MQRNAASGLFTKPSNIERCTALFWRHPVKRITKYIRLCALSAILMAAGCAFQKTPEPVVTGPALVKLQVSAYPALTDDMNYEGMDRAIRMSLTYLKKVPADRVFMFGADPCTAGHLIRSLEFFQKILASRPSPAELSAEIQKNYQIYQAAGDAATGKVLFTGYYEPVLNGSPVETGKYRYPLYSRPDDLVTIELSRFSPKFSGETLIGRYTGKTVVPYYDRKDIDAKKDFHQRARVLAWVDDRIGLFFLQIQGSGKIQMGATSEINAHYQITNGRPYRSIGKILVDEGKIPRAQVSMQRIRAYLKAHPQEVDAILDANPSYVFFKLEPDGPLGNLNAPLTPGRSVAVDKKCFPPAALMYIQAQKPVMDGSGEIASWEPLDRFAVNQDTGGAITGAGRADIFWGSGSYAELAAGYLQHRGNMYFLVLKPGIDR